MRRVALWSAGLAVSLVLHAGAGAALMIALRPEQVEDQPQPETRMEVESYALDRDKAPEATPEAEQTQAADPAGDRLGAGAIPQSTARATAPTAQPLSAEQAMPAALSATETTPDTAPAARLDTTRITSSTAAAARLAPDTVLGQTAPAEPLPEPVRLTNAPARPVTAQARAPEAEHLAVTQLPQQAAQALDQTSVRVASGRGPTQSVTATALEPAATAASRPTPAPLQAAAQTTALPIASARPSADPLSTVAAPAQGVPESALQPDRLRATLAFPGGGEGIDPASLAAFQSFMEPGDLTVGSDPLRDGVSALLAQVPCSRLQVGFDPETTTLTVKGHIPGDDLRAPVLAALQKQMGADITVADTILILPRPQCGALSGISNVGLPQSTDQDTNPLLIGEDTHARVLGFVKDDRLFFDITAPEYPAHIYVDYFDAEGNVLHLMPNSETPLVAAEPDTVLRIGTADDSDPGLRLFIGPPYGQEIAVAFAASAPLYEGLRPLVEPAAPYLKWLRARVAEARATNPEFKGEWVYFFVTTSAE